MTDKTMTKTKYRRIQSTSYDFKRADIVSIWSNQNPTGGAVVNSKRAMPRKQDIQIDIAGVDGANHSFKITFLAAVRAADRIFL